MDLKQLILKTLSFPRDRLGLIVINPPSKYHLQKGGVLLIGNHQSKIDWLYLQLAVPFPLQFIVDSSYWRRWYFRGPLKLSGAIPISRFGAAKGLKKMGEVLEKGGAVALFPEGHLTRNGGLSIFREGWKMGVPLGRGVQILPFAIVGLWGSRFSYALEGVEGFRRPVIVFGKPVPAEVGVQWEGEKWRNRVWELFKIGWRRGVGEKWKETSFERRAGEWLSGVWGPGKRFLVEEGMGEGVLSPIKFTSPTLLRLWKGGRGEQLGKLLFRQKIEVVVGSSSLFNLLLGTGLGEEWLKWVQYPVVVLEKGEKVGELRRRFREKFLKNLYLMEVKGGRPVGLELRSELMEDLFFQPGYPPHPIPD
ncbi:MAG: 1-acyl-sn-glycerol-3-phosphate acyltransferase [Campylobacterales bacterium]